MGTSDVVTVLLARLMVRCPGSSFDLVKIIEQGPKLPELLEALPASLVNSLEQGD